MKIQYLGDVSDYRKYALLRLLAAFGLKIGIHWLLTPSDGRSDGGKRAYLTQPDTWRAYDPDLFDSLADVPTTPTLQDFEKVEREGIVPQATYLNDAVPYGTAARERHHADSMTAFASCDLVFFDPDNGIATASVSKSRAAGAKFVFDDELAYHYAAGRSLLVYQHFPHVERTAYIAALAEKLQSLAPAATIWACQTSHVAFMLVGQPHHFQSLEAAVEEGQRRWPEMFMRFSRATNPAPAEVA